MLPRYVVSLKLPMPFYKHVGFMKWPGKKMARHVPPGLFHAGLLHMLLPSLRSCRPARRVARPPAFYLLPMPWTFDEAPSSTTGIYVFYWRVINISNISLYLYIAISRKQVENLKLLQSSAVSVLIFYIRFCSEKQSSRWFFCHKSGDFNILQVSEVRVQRVADRQNMLNLECGPSRFRRERHIVRKFRATALEVLLGSNMARVQDFVPKSAGSPTIRCS